VKHVDFWGGEGNTLTSRVIQYSCDQDFNSLTNKLEPLEALPFPLDGFIKHRQGANPDSPLTIKGLVNDEFFLCFTMASQFHYSIALALEVLVNAFFQ